MKRTASCFKRLGLVSDHAGLSMKLELLDFLKSYELELVDYGPAADLTSSVDYPDYASKLASDVSKGLIDAGIAICGTGLGMCIVCNKHKGVRAVSAWDEYTAKMGRAHNDANVLCLGGRILSVFRAKDLAGIWVSTPFAGGQHELRVQKIQKLEQAQCR